MAGVVRPTPFKNAEFQLIFAHSAVTLRKISLIMTNNMGFPLSNEPNMNSICCH